MLKIRSMQQEIIMGELKKQVFHLLIIFLILRLSSMREKRNRRRRRILRFAILNRMQIRRQQQMSLIDRSGTVCLHNVLDLTTLLGSDIGPFEVLNVRWVLEICLKSEVTLKVYFKQTVPMVIMIAYIR